MIHHSPQPIEQKAPVRRNVVPATDQPVNFHSHPRSVQALDELNALETGGFRRRRMFIQLRGGFSNSMGNSQAHLNFPGQIN